MAGIGKYQQIVLFIQQEKNSSIASTDLESIPSSTALTKTNLTNTSFAEKHAPKV